MRYARFFLPTILLMCISFASYGEAWSPMGTFETTQKVVYLDTDSILRVGDAVSFRTKHELPNSFFSFNKFRDIVDYFVINCAERKFVVNRKIGIKDTGEEQVLLDKPVAHEDFVVVSANSLIAISWSRFCPAKVASTPIAAPVAAPAAPASPATTAAPPERKKPSEPEISVTTGTGWHVADGYIVTAFHIIEGASVVSVNVGKYGPLPAKVVTYDPNNDLAILRVEHPSLKDGLALATTPLRLGGKIFTLGYPLADKLGVKVQVTSGEVSALTGFANDPRFYQITAPVQSGASGGPIFSENGQVVGVIISKTNFLKQDSGRVEILQNVNFAVKYPYVSALLETAGVRFIRGGKKPPSHEDAVSQSIGQVFYIEAYSKKE